MKEIVSLKEMRSISASARQNGQTMGFVPTMGFLHKGHTSLIQESVRNCHRTVVSIFVNPLQFGLDEDFENYPRDPDGDALKCREAGADYLFLPEVDEIIGKSPAAVVKIEKISDILCGVSRPGHFQGVATIVLKLLNIVQPDRLFMGEKDFQQTVIVNKMIQDLFIPVKLTVAPTVRESDGLAMSSRNSYLNPGERKSAAVLYRAMKKGEEAFLGGERQVSFLRRMVENEIKRARSAKIDYVKIVDPGTLDEIKEITGSAVILLAVWIGKTRLIDNLRLRV
ncbi:MAG: pantoate--beta-alanine ligase [Nitrospiria bacterium]